MLLSHRNSDAVIAVYQNNEAEEIIIHDLNPVAEKLLGYAKEELAGQSIKSILPPRIFSLLDEYVEFEMYGNDVGSVLNKVSSFCVVDKSEKEHSLQVKVQRSTPIDTHDQFTLILQAEQNNRRNEAFRSLLRENFKGHEVLDADTQLPNRTSLIKDIELVMFYVNKQELSASVAIIELDDLSTHEEKHGAEGVALILRHIAKICRQNLRGDDTLGLVGAGRVGLILFDTKGDSAQMVLNRLRWLIAANGSTMDDGELASLSVRVVYSTLTPDVSTSEKVLTALDKVLDDDGVGANRVHQLQTDK